MKKLQVSHRVYLFTVTPFQTSSKLKKENHSKLEKIKPIKGINIKWIYANAKMKLSLE